MTARSTIFYFPTLFALFSVLCVFMFFIWPIEKKEHLHSMEVHWYNKEAMGKRIKIPQRRVMDITFTGDTETDRKKLEFGQLYTRGIITNKDTVHAIDFHFGKKSKYATFVAVLDICNMEDVKVFFPSDNGIMVIYPNPAPREKDIKTIEIRHMPL